MSLKEDLLLGQLAVRLKMVTEAQIEDCYAGASGSAIHQPLDQMLLKKGYLSEEQVRTLRREHANARQQASNTMRSTVSLSRFARSVIQAGAVVELEVMKASRDREREKVAGNPRPLGEILIERGLITKEGIEVIVSDQIAKAPTCPKCNDFFIATRATAGNLFECSGCGYKLMMPRQVTQLMDLNEVNALRADAGIPRSNLPKKR